MTDKRDTGKDVQDNTDQSHIDTLDMRKHEMFPSQVVASAAYLAVAGASVLAAAAIVTLGSDTPAHQTSAALATQTQATCKEVFAYHAKDPDTALRNTLKLGTGASAFTLSFMKQAKDPDEVKGGIYVSPTAKPFDIESADNLAAGTTVRAGDSDGILMMGTLVKTGTTFFVQNPAGYSMQARVDSVTSDQSIKMVSGGTRLKDTICLRYQINENKSDVFSAMGALPVAQSAPKLTN